MHIDGHHASAAVASVSLITLTAYYGSKWTRENSDTPWYQCIRPSFAPPSIVFPIVWSLLYLGLFVALFNAFVAVNVPVSGLFLLNLISNVMWCYLFFGKKSPSQALYPMAVLLITSIGILSLSSDLWILVPVVLYTAWLSFAGVLNLSASMKEKECQ